MPVAVSKPDYYTVLELDHGATEDEIRVAYKKLALKWHPDRHQEHKDEAQEKFVEVQTAYLQLLEDYRHRNKRKARKTKSESGKSFASSVHTAASGSSASSERSEARSTPEKSRHGSHKQREHRTEEGPPRPPDTSPSVKHKKPRKLSKQAPLRPDRHGNHSHARSERDNSTDDESYSSKSKKPRRSKSGDHLAADSDFEFVELADLGTALPPLRSPKRRGGATLSEEDWIFPLPLTLEELYHGVSQNYRITRTLRSGETQSVKIHLRVSPSWRDGTRVRVPGVGNERADGGFQDIVFVVEEQPHAAFVRAGDDVLVSVQVPWADAPPRPYSSSSDATEDDADACGEEDEAVYVRALGGREYAVPIPRSLVEAADGTRIVGAGMPVRKGGKLLGRGDLIIKWEFAFADADKGQRHRWQQLKKAMHWKL